MAEIIDLTGRRFTRLLVLEQTIRIRNRVTWLCQCDCGKRVSVLAKTLKSGAVKSCNCLNRELSSARLRTHGFCKTLTYKIWKNMRMRCSNPNNKSYKNYGGRGIKVCERWASFDAFLKDMGFCPKGLSIDRIDNSKGYFPENCQWRSKYDQANNTRKNRIFEYKGRKQTIAQWAREFNMPFARLWQRLSLYGYTIEQALTQPNFKKFRNRIGCI